MERDQLIGRRADARAPRGERRGDRRARVDDEHVAATQMSAEVTHDAMTDVVIVGPRYQQSYFIPREAACFGRLVRQQRVRDVEVDAADEHWLPCSRHRAHAAAGAASRATSDATYRPLGKSP